MIKFSTKRESILVILLCLLAINIYDVWYKPSAWDLLMDINENNTQLLETGDPIPGIDDPRIKYRVTALNKVTSEISFSNIIDVKPSMYIYVPNAFTPNGDGLNDTFGGLGRGVKKYHLIIYNRWGQLVFESNKQSNQWDGTYGGKLSPVGSYPYVIEVKGYYNKKFHKEGTISIVKV
jgi:gliding motility-associated-like protein